MTTSITTRAGKGSPLTHDEVDANFTNLQTTADAALPLAGGTLTGPVTMTGGTVTTSAPLIDATQTWNASGVTFTGWKLNITNTASASGSKLVDWQVGAVSKASIDTSGKIIFSGTGTISKSGEVITLSDSVSSYAFVYAYRFRSTNAEACIGNIGHGTHGVSVSASAAFSFSNTNADIGTADIQLWRDAAATLAQRDGTNAQTYRIYGTYTDSSNYVRASLGATSTTVTLAAETAGTGADNIDVTLTPAGTGVVASGSPIKTQSTTVSGLMSAATAGAGARAFVTDATATTFLSTVAGGGSNKVPVVSDGTNWLIG